MFNQRWMRWFCHRRRLSFLHMHINTQNANPQISCVLTFSTQNRVNITSKIAIKSNIGKSCLLLVDIIYFQSGAMAFARRAVRSVYHLVMDNTINFRLHMNFWKWVTSICVVLTCFYVCNDSHPSASHTITGASPTMPIGLFSIWDIIRIQMRWPFRCISPNRAIARAKKPQIQLLAMRKSIGHRSLRQCGKPVELQRMFWANARNCCG